jgi:hypothetical protein
MTNNQDSNYSDWRALCKLASHENDPYRLLDLISRINRALEECNRQRGADRTAIGIESVVMPLKRLDRRPYSDLERLPLQPSLAGVYDS